MTDHRMRASTRESIFASQLWRIVFIFEGEELGETTPKTPGSKFLSITPAVAKRNHAGFLGDDDDDGVAFLRQPERRAVPQAERAVEIGALGDGENARGGDDAVAADDDAAVVQRVFGKKRLTTISLESAQSIFNAALPRSSRYSCPRSMAMSAPSWRLARSKVISRTRSSVARFCCAPKKRRLPPRAARPRRSSGWKMMTSAMTSTFDKLSNSEPMTMRPRSCESIVALRKRTTSPTRTFAPGVPRKNFQV